MYLPTAEALECPIDDKHKRPTPQMGRERSSYSRQLQNFPDFSSENKRRISKISGRPTSCDAGLCQ